MKYFTDYDISWDYELAEDIDKQYLSMIKDIVKELKTKIKHEIIKNIIIVPILLRQDILGVYCFDTFQWIGLDIGNILQACDEIGNISYYIAIKTTILHEIAHAIQNYKGKELNETEAEDFARDYVDFGIINKI